MNYFKEHKYLVILAFVGMLALLCVGLVVMLSFLGIAAFSEENKNQSADAEVKIESYQTSEKSSPDFNQMVTDNDATESEGRYRLQLLREYEDQLPALIITDEDTHELVASYSFPEGEGYSIAFETETAVKVNNYLVFDAIEAATDCYYFGGQEGNCDTFSQAYAEDCEKYCGLWVYDLETETFHLPQNSQD